MEITQEASEWLNEKQAAQYLHVSTASLRKWRSFNRCPSKISTTPPPCSACGNRYLYNKNALHNWLLALSINTEQK